MRLKLTFLNFQDTKSDNKILFFFDERETIKINDLFKKIESYFVKKEINLKITKMLLGSYSIDQEYNISQVLSNDDEIE